MQSKILCRTKIEISSSKGFKTNLNFESAIMVIEKNISRNDKAYEKDINIIKLYNLFSMLI